MADNINPAGSKKGLGVNFLPNFYKTDANKRFLQATIDQLVQPGTVKKVNGYIGRQYAKATTGTDIFVDAADKTRQNYQLEPSFTVNDTLGNNTFFKDYIDYINQLGVFGANTDNHARLNKQEFYSWDPHIDWDKFVNFQNYYWLPYGPETIKVYGQQRNAISSYSVKLQSEGANNQYVFTPDGLTANPVLKLYRGQTYRFEIDSVSNPFSIKTARTTSASDIYSIGVTNNSIETGTIIFKIPPNSPNVLYYQSETDINLGGVFQIYDVNEDSFIDVEADIIGKKFYALSNGTKLSNGMKLSFGGNVNPIAYATGEYYVEGVGTAIQLINKSILEVSSVYSQSEVLKFDSTPFDSDGFGDSTGFAKTLDYIVINRASLDHNPWSRYNRWFHKDVIETSAKYNNATVGLDQTLRAVRPVIEFEANLKLFNFGTTAIADIDLIDSFTTDAFSIIEGKSGYNVDGVTLAEGQQILFLADTDRLVKNNLYRVEFIDVLHSSAGSRQIRLVKIAEPVLNNVVLVKQGIGNQGLMYWYNGTTWLPAQQKIDVNQAPLFDIVDDLNQSFGDKTVYDGTTFLGTQLFSYKIGNGTPDTNLGFALSYKNIANIGDIVFNFNLATDTFQYKDIITIINKSIKTGYLVKTNYTGNINFANGWQIATSPTTQAAIRIYKNSNKTNNFDIDIFDNVLDLKDLIVRVYINGKRLARDHWTLITKSDYKNIVLKTDMLLTDVLTIRAFAAQPINSNGFYEIPVNLKNNPLNGDIADFTLGEVIDHVDSIIDNIYMEDADSIEEVEYDLDSDITFIGVFPGASNLRDLGNVTQYGTKFVQHSGPASLSLYHITSSTNNIVRAIEQARDHYNQFKRNFISAATSLSANVTPIEQVNLILQELNKDKSNNFPYYFSDMVPYRASVKNNITVIDGRVKFYPLTNVFNLDELSNKAVGVYLNGVQLIHAKDYIFDSQGFVNVSATLAENDVISIYEYDNTDGSFIPETPTKLGMWPKYEPKMYLDTSLRTPRMIIQGHDGSQILAYNDYRDDIILELEKRIFNNIKISYDTTIFDIADIIPSYNRTTDYSLTEFNEVLAPSFYKWSSLIDRDFTKPLNYDKDEPFTFNYTGHNAPDGRRIPGYWKGIYQWILDTERPQLCPWEMLGFTIEPLWWQEVYGPAPYTSDNRVMWQDITDGAIRQPGVPSTYTIKYAKPFLMKHIPVDEFGNLISPLASGLSSSPLTARSTDGFIFGDIGPVESTWRRSSYYAFSVILTSILSTPSNTFGILLDRSKIVRNLTGQLVYKDTGLRVTPADIVLPSIYSSTTRKQTSGILNYIVNYILSDNLKSYTDYQYDLLNIKTQLSYRVAGFTSKEKFNLLLDSKSPLSSGNVFVPPENYTTILNTSSPVRKITYSGVIITKISDTAYEVKGYSKTQPYFKIYNFLQSGRTINVGGISESFTNWENNQNYVVGKVVKFANKFYRTTISHLSVNGFNPNNFKSLSALPIIGGRDAILRKTWDKESAITVPYGTRFLSPQEVVDFLIGYGECLKDQGFIFDDFNTTLNAVTNWETSAKEFLFWTTQHWATGQEHWVEWNPEDSIEYGNIVRYNGEYYQALRKVAADPTFNKELFVKLDGLSSIGSPVISLSPAADKIIFNANLCVIDDIRNPFNGYEIFKADGTPLEAMLINSYREDNAVSYSSRTSDGIYGASFYLIQHEHVVLLDNSTMFNDTVYSPETGYKQDRIKVAGYVSNEWYGGLDIPGFILDVANIQNWLAWQDYDLGDIVKYKQFFYTASKFLAGSQIFVAENWIKLDKKPVTQLLPNWTYKAAQFEDFYSLDSDNFDSGQQKMAQHLIGYQKRQYLENIIQNDVSEFKFYQGMIIEKGTQNSLNKLFDVLSADGEDSLTFYEEWAIRAGQYGASSAFDNVEFILDESLFKNNPQGYELSDTTNTFTNFIIRQNANQVYLKPLAYNNNPWPAVNNYKPFLRSAGYVRSSEVFLTLKNLSDITSYDIATFTNKCYIWVTFEKNDWNVYQFTNSNINVSDLQYEAGSKILTVTTTELLTLQAGEYIGLSQVLLLNGFYKIESVSQNKFTISITINGWSQQLIPALVLKINVNVLISRRILSIDGIDQSITSNLELGEQIWTDETTSGKWASWEYTPIYETTELTNSSPANLLNYGRYIASNQQGTLVAISTALGELQTWDKAGYKSPWLQRQNIQRPYISSVAGTGTLDGPAGNLPNNIATVTAISPDGKWMATGSKLASNVYTRIKILGPYVIGDITYNVADTYYYEARISTSTTDFSNGSIWKKLLYVPVTLIPGQDSQLIEQGVISLYKKDSNNIFTIVNSIVSPNPTNYEHFGSNLVFGDNVLYVTASGYNNNAGKIYKLQYTTTVYKTAYYNPVGSLDTTLALSKDVGSLVNPTVGIMPGMIISGTGFTKGQTVLEVLSNGTALIISDVADSTPSGKLNFSFTGWSYDKEVTYDGAIANANFGSTLSISSNNNTLVISSNNGTTAGKILVVTNPGPNETRQLLQGTTTSFGETISLSPDASYLAIGDSLETGGKQFQGSVTIYEKTSLGYIPYQELVNHKAEESGYFGSRVAFMNGSNTLVVYSSYEDTILKTSFDQYTVPLYDINSVPTISAGKFDYVNAIQYKIKSLGNTDWNIAAGTIGVTYEVGNIFIAKTAGIGTGTAYLPELLYITDPTSDTNISTQFDKDSTRFTSTNVDSGRIDIYDKYASKWVYSETLNNTLTIRDGYGIGFAVGNDRVVVGAPYALDHNLVSGKVFDYLKPPSTNSWAIKYQEVSKPDVNKIRKAFLYNRVTGKLITYLDVIDVAQGRPAGPAAEEIKYQSFYDPAIYSAGTGNVNVDADSPWNTAQVGRLWWDLRTAKFINSYDSDVMYRTNTWNTLATGASIDIYEWVETTLLPDAWNKLADTEAGIAAGISGTSLYGNGVYALRQRYDSVSQSFKNTYYYWIKNKKTIPNVSGRYLSAQAVASLIENPRGQGYTYLALTGTNSFSLINSKQYLKDTDVVLSVEYWTIDKIDNNVHSQWKIVNNDANTVLPASIELKWFDSLCGKDLAGRDVPDLSLPPKLKYGIENRPRQGMFVNRFEALKQFIEQVNLILKNKQIVTTRNLSNLKLYDTAPSLVTGLYDSTENTDAELRFVNIGAYKRPIFGNPIIVDGRITGLDIQFPGRGYVQAPYINIIGSGTGAKVRAIINAVGQITGVTVLSAGEGYDSSTIAAVRDYSVLVYSDSQALSAWSLYSYEPTEKTWSRLKSQTYNTQQYWSYIDWFANGYNQFTVADHAVDTLAELSAITVEIGQLVKVRNPSSGNWLFVEKYADADLLDYTRSYNVVGIGNGTIQFSSAIYESINTDEGYDGSTYDGSVFDNAPTTELRIILTALKDDILIDELRADYLDLFFTTVRYALSEQIYLDWIFKSSFIKARHNVGLLDQPVTYKNDNLANYQEYIAEVKPYKTKIREYVSSYQNIELGSTLISDFDLPPRYKNNKVIAMNSYVSNGSLVTLDPVFNSYPWKNWVDTLGFVITGLKIIDGGSGYITEPVVRIISDSGSGATARAFFSNGIINRIILLTPGSGYLSTPTIIIDGGLLGTGTPARVVAVIGKGLPRSNLIQIKFDRITQSYYVTHLEETETFSPNGSRLQFPLTWAPDNTIGSSTITVSGVTALRDSYKLSVVSTKTGNSTKYSGLITFATAPTGGISVTYKKNVALLNAADRINYFYNPQEGDIGNDLSQLMTGIDYGGVVVTGLGFDISTGWGVLPYFTDKWGSDDSEFDDYIVTVRIGTGAKFEITMTDLGSNTWSINVIVALGFTGINYSIGNYINILGSAIGGTDGINDLAIKVETIGLGGSILTAVGDTRWNSNGYTAWGIYHVVEGSHIFPSNPSDSLPTTWPIGSEFNIYHTKYDIETHEAVADQLVYSYNVYKDNPAVSVIYPTTSGGVSSNYIPNAIPIDVTGFTVLSGIAHITLSQVIPLLAPPFLQDQLVVLTGFSPLTTSTDADINKVFKVLTCTTTQVTFELDGSYTVSTLGRIASSATTLKVVDTSDIEVGMAVIGTGFTSYQVVTSKNPNDNKTLTISAAPDSNPNGTLSFTNSIRGGYTVQLLSTAGILVGDTIKTSSVSAFGLGTVVTDIVGNSVVLNQIIYETLPPETLLEFSRDLIIPNNVNIYTAGIITLNQPVEVGSTIKITGKLGPYRLDDPYFGITSQGLWEPSHNYIINQVVTIHNGNSYGCTITHTSGPALPGQESIVFDNDVKLGRWQLVNPSAIMIPQIYTGNIRQTVSIPGDYVIDDGDTIILRKITSDGSIKSQDTDYDTALSGGNMVYSTATGILPDDIILDGDDLISPTTSPAPEEVVPGQVVDTVAIKVYDQPPSGSANIKIANHVGDSVTVTFNIGQTPNSKEALIVKRADQLLDSSEYTVDYRNRTVTLTTVSPPSDNEIISIYSIGFNGSNILDIDHFVGDGVTQEFITRAPWLASITSLIYVDGIPVTPDIFKTDDTYNSVNRVAMRFGVAPEIGALLSFIVVAGDQQSFAVTKNERIITNGSNVYSLEYKVGESLPNESNMFVRVNNNIIPGPVSSYFTISNNRLNYTIDPTKVTPYSTAIGNIFVYVGDKKLNLGSDYTIELGGITVKINKLIYSQYAKQTLVVSVTTDQGYSYNPTTNQIAFTESYSNLDVVEVISSYKHDILDIERTTLTVSSNLSLTPDSVEYYSYKGITNGTLTLDRAVISDSYVWVIQNETILVPSIDYKLNEGRTSIQLTIEPSIDDKITLMTFGSNILMPGISYMQFKDMLNRVHYKRLSLNKQTVLTTDLNFDDRTIEVENADNFDKPNPLKNKPGIIEIRGERIEFYGLDGNVLSKLRRGTLGTGTPLVHKAGTYVQELGPTESIPYTDSSIVEQVISDGESIIIPLNFTPATSGVDQWFTNFGFILKGNYDTARGYNANDVVIYENLYYVNIKSYVFDTTITILPTNTTYWKIYNTNIPPYQGVWQHDFDNTALYSVNDLVYYPNSITYYVCIATFVPDPESPNKYNPTNAEYWTPASMFGQCDEIEVFVGGYDTSVNWISNVKYDKDTIVTLGSYTYKCLTEHTSTSNFKNDIANWTFFIGNIRLKKSPYKMHNENQAPNSPLGDIKLDAEFSVDGTSSAIRLTNKLSFGTRITIIKRNGTDWDSKTNIQYDNSKIAEFLKATPGTWYAENAIPTVQ